MKIRFLIDFNSFTEELAKLLNGNIPSRVGAPWPRSPSPQPSPSLLPLWARKLGALPGTSTWSGTSRERVLRMSFKIFSLDLAED